MLLRERCADRTWRDANNPRRLAGPGILAVGPRRMIERVLQNAWYGAVVLGRHKQDALRGGDLGF